MAGGGGGGGCQVNAAGAPGVVLMGQLPPTPHSGAPGAPYRNTSPLQTAPRRGCTAVSLVSTGDGVDRGEDGNGRGADGRARRRADGGGGVCGNGRRERGVIGGREEHDDGRTDATRGTCTHRAAEHGLCDLAGLGVEDADMSHGPCPVPVVHMHVGVAGPEEEREVEQSAQSEEAQVLPGASERAREGAEGGGWGGGGVLRRASPHPC